MSAWEAIDLVEPEDEHWHLEDPAERYGFAALLGHAPPAWHDDAACRNRPDVSWFPERGQDTARLEPSAPAVPCVRSAPTQR